MAVRKDSQLCSTIRDRVDKWDKYWTINRSLYYEWIDFVMGDQWREDESKLFERYNKIPLMFNKLGVLMNHLLGDQMANTPSLQIMPDPNVPVKTADTRAALIKNISLNSDTKTIFQTAFGQAIVGGYSAIIAKTAYLHDMSFDQEILAEGVEDPNRCYWDISAKTKCKTDGMWAGFKTRISRKKFKDMYGKVEQDIGSSSITEDSTMAFADDDSITQVDDFERIAEKTTIYKLSDDRGTVVDSEEFKKLEKRKIDGVKYIIYNDQALTVLEKREVVKYRIKHRQIAGDYVLEETDFPSEQLPIIFVDQKSYYTKQGQQITRSFFKDVKDAQKYLNYLATQTAYILKVSRYDQFMAPRKCVSAPDTAQQWRDPSVVRGAIVYDETLSGAKPEPLRPPELSQSLVQQYERTLIDMQTGTGIFSVQMGDQGNENSGKAIDGRRKAGTQNTRVPFNSIDIAIACFGQIVNEMIPKVYDTERLLMLSMPESENQPVEINKSDEYGLQTENDMTTGHYKIRLKPGLSYEGQKQEALESLQSVLMADKSGQIFPMVADLYAENLPLDNNLELRNRLRTLVSPEIIEAGKTGKPIQRKDPPPDPMIELKKQELQLQSQNMQQQMQLKMQELQHKQAELQRKALETHQDMTMEWEKLEAEKQEKAAELQESILRYQSEMQRLGADLQINHSQNLIKMLTHAGQIHHEKAMQHHDHQHQIKIKPQENRL